MLRALILLLFFPLSLSAPAQDPGDELLPPEQAYRLRVDVQDPQTLVASWEIAEGYYMYRHAFEFRIDEPGVRLGEPQLPKGKVKHDEFFGDVEIYRKSVSIVLPLIREPGSPKAINLHTRAQGCADIGVCYPPMDQTVRVELPPLPGAGRAESAAASSGSRAAPLARLESLASGDTSEDEFLPPDEAFRFVAGMKDPQTALLEWEVADGYYLYRDKFRFRAEPAGSVTLGEPRLPAGQTKHDEFFGEVTILKHRVRAEIPVHRLDPDLRRFTLVAEYQGCAESGICYPPITKSISLELPPESAAGPTSAPSEAPEQVGDRAGPQAVATGGGAAPESAGGTPDTPYQSEQDRLASMLATGNVFWVLLVFFGFGLLLTFTPCVFPMIPILSGIIIGQGKAINTGRAFVLSSVYVLAMALTYTVAGVIVGLSGENVQAWFQNPWVLGLFAGVFVLLALSMFGFYELQMPASIQTRLTRIANSQQGGTLTGVAIMGFLSALIVGPCVTAPLIAALLYIAHTGDAVLGGLALFSLSLGMGVPLIIVGTSAGKLLPKAGPWMDAIKAFFGVLLLGLAVWMLERILPVQITMVLAAALFIVPAVYLRVFDPLGEHASGWSRFWKGMGLVSFLYGLALFAGALGGGSSFLQPLKVFTGSAGPMQGGAAGVAAEALHFERIKSKADLDRVLARAQAQKRPVMLDFYADWCISCKEMEAFTFTDPRVRAALDDAILVQADVTANDAEDKALLKHFGLFGPPAILFFGPDGEERRAFRVMGYMPAEAFAAHVRKALAS